MCISYDTLISLIWTDGIAPFIKVCLGKYMIHHLFLREIYVVTKPPRKTPSHTVELWDFSDVFWFRKYQAYLFYFKSALDRKASKTQAVWKFKK